MDLRLWNPVIDTIESVIYLMILMTHVSQYL